LGRVGAHLVADVAGVERGVVRHFGPRRRQDPDPDNDGADRDDRRVKARRDPRGQAGREPSGLDRSDADDQQARKVESANETAKEKVLVARHEVDDRTERRPAEERHQVHDPQKKEHPIALVAATADHASDEPDRQEHCQHR